MVITFMGRGFVNFDNTSFFQAMPAYAVLLYLSIYVSIYLTNYLSIYLSICLCIYLCIYLSN